MKLFLLGVLLATAVAQEILLTQSDTSTSYVASSSPTSNVVVLDTYTGRTGDLTGYGAKWIWVDGGSPWPTNLVVTFKK